MALLRQLRITSYGELTSVEAIRLQGDLLSSNWSRCPEETIDNFAARTIDVHRDLSDHGLHLDSSIIKQCFIMGLGPDFTKIEEDLQWNRLKPEWQSNNIVNLVDPARKVLCISSNLRANNQHYKDIHKKQSSSSNTPKDDKTKPTHPDNEISKRKAKARQNRIQYAINNGTFKISDFINKVPPKACVFHGVPHDGLKDSSKECSYINKTSYRHS